MADLTKFNSAKLREYRFHLYAYIEELEKMKDANNIPTSSVPTSDTVMMGYREKAKADVLGHKIRKYQTKIEQVVNQNLDRPFTFATDGITLTKIAEQMKKHINTPVGPVGEPKPLGWVGWAWGAKPEPVEMEPLDFNYNLENGNTNKQENAGKTVFVRSAWAVIHILSWIEYNYFLIKYIDNIPELILAAFLQNIATAGQCGITCDNKIFEPGTTQCYFDSYSDILYNGADPHIYPDFCGDILMGISPFCTVCPCGYNTETEFATCNHTSGQIYFDNPDKGKTKGENKDQRITAINNWKTQTCNDTLDKNFYLDLSVINNANFDQKHIALAGYMHPELNIINLSYSGISTLKKEYQANIYTAAMKEIKNLCVKYIDRFVYICEILALTPTLNLLNLCIAVSCAYICAGAAPTECTDDEIGDLGDFINKNEEYIKNKELVTILNQDVNILVPTYASEDVWNTTWNSDSLNYPGTKYPEPKQRILMIYDTLIKSFIENQRRGSTAYETNSYL